MVLVDRQMCSSKVAVGCRDRLMAVPADRQILTRRAISCGDRHLGDRQVAVLVDRQMSKEGAKLGCGWTINPSSLSAKSGEGDKIQSYVTQRPRYRYQAQ